MQPFLSNRFRAILQPSALQKRAKTAISACHKTALEVGDLFL
jgi:hypothetical protein